MERTPEISELAELRAALDMIDTKILRAVLDTSEDLLLDRAKVLELQELHSVECLIAERMELVQDIAQYKREHDLKVLDVAREEEVLQRIYRQVAGEFPNAAVETRAELAANVVELFRKLIELSRQKQQSLMER